MTEVTKGLKVGDVLVYKGNSNYFFTLDREYKITESNEKEVNFLNNKGEKVKASRDIERDGFMGILTKFDLKV